MRKKYLVLLFATGCFAPFDMAEMSNLRRAKAWATGRGHDYAVVIYDVTDGRMPYKACYISEKFQKILSEGDN